MPTLQEDREQYNSNIKGNMDFLLHGDTSEVARSGLKKAQDLKSGSAERQVGSAQNSARSGLNRVQSAEPETSTRANANTYSPARSSSYGAGAVATENTATAHRSNALRAEPTQNYRVKFESGTNRSAGAAEPSAYDKINDTIRNNPRHLGTPILGDAAATTAERRMYSQDARKAFDSVSSRTVTNDATLREMDVKPNATLNRTVEDAVTYTPTSNTMGYERIVISNEAVKECREEGIKNQRAKEEESAGIPTQVKVIAAVIAAAIILAFTVIFINSALLNSLDLEINSLSAQLETLVTGSSDLETQIAEATSAETVIEYAKEAGMIYIGG